MAQKCNRTPWIQTSQRSHQHRTHNTQINIHINGKYFKSKEGIFIGVNSLLSMFNLADRDEPLHQIQNHNTREVCPQHKQEHPSTQEFTTQFLCPESCVNTAEQCLTWVKVAASWLACILLSSGREGYSSSLEPSFLCGELPASSYWNQLTIPFHNQMER